MNSRSLLSLASAALCALSLSACAGSSREVESVARTDLGCDQLTIAEIAQNRYAASGCGKGGVYAQMCGNGQACSWVRLKSATEGETAGGAYPIGPVRDVAQAPGMPQREVIQAPPPAQREIIQAPPPAPQSAASVDPSLAPSPTSADAQSYSTQQTPLSNGDLSQPYQAQVPLTPTAQRSDYPPPAPLPEQQPPPPSPNYQWVGGYWSWGNSNWLWAPGYWTPPMYGYNYTPGSWYWANNYWWYGPGGWARPNSTYIAFGVGARPYGYATTRSFTPRVGGADPGRIGAQPLHQGSFGRAPSGGSFTPQGSPMYRYPTSVSNPVSSGPGRMGSAPSHSAPSGFSGYNSHPTYPSGSATYPAAAPARMGSSPSYGGNRGGYSGGSNSTSNSFGGGGGSFGGSSGPSRFGSGPSHSEVRSAPMGRSGGSAPSAPSPSYVPARSAPMGRSGGGAMHVGGRH